MDLKIKIHETHKFYSNTIIKIDIILIKLKIYFIMIIYNVITLWEN
jgi:hypothetical protein